MAILVITLAVACSGSDSNDSRVLHFGGRDETEANYRARIKQAFGSTPLAIGAICTPLKGLSPKETLPLVPIDPQENPTFPGATPRPGQVAREADLLRAAGILIEECAKVTK